MIPQFGLMSFVIISHEVGILNGTYYAHFQLLEQLYMIHSLK